MKQEPPERLISAPVTSSNAPVSRPVRPHEQCEHAIPAFEGSLRMINNQEGKHAGPERSGYEVIDSSELATRWSIPVTWVRDQTRSRAVDPLPCVRLAKYVRFEWGSPALNRWWDRHRSRQ